MNHRPFLPFLSLLAVILLSSCGKTENEFSSRPCVLIFDNSTHNDATLAAAMTPYSGTFVTITLTNHRGARYFKFSSNQGISSESILDAIDLRRSMILGMNDALIVGYGNLSDNNGILPFYAFDRECPNCFDPDEIPVRSYPLHVNTAGIATCNICKRKYNLNNGGILSDGDAGNKMTRYRASTTGPYGILAVN